MRNREKEVKLRCRTLVLDRTLLNKIQHQYSCTKSWERRQSNLLEFIGWVVIRSKGLVKVEIDQNTPQRDKKRNTCG